MGRKIKKAIKKVIPNEVVAPFVPSPPAVVEPEPIPKPTPDPVKENILKVAGTIANTTEPVTSINDLTVNPEPTPTPTPDPVATPDPVVSDPVPVEETPTETEETAQAVQRKKKGRKSLINTSSTGLGGSATVYTPTLLG